MKLALLLAIVFALFALSTAVMVDFTDCASGSFVTLKQFEANVWPPVKEQEFTLKTSAVANKEITEGQWTMTTSWSGMQVDKQSGPLSNFGDISLPIKEGQFQFVNVGTIPSASPSGQYTLTTKAQTSDGQDIFCYKINFKL
eukprot:UN02126